MGKMERKHEEFVQRSVHQWKTHIIAHGISRQIYAKILSKWVIFF